jgi:hypothetical protein
MTGPDIARTVGALRRFIEMTTPHNLSTANYMTPRSGPQGPESEVVAALETVEPILNRYEDINRLLIVASEPFQRFADGLQRQIEKQFGVEFRNKIVNRRQQRTVRVREATPAAGTIRPRRFPTAPPGPYRPRP